MDEGNDTAGLSLGPLIVCFPAARAEMRGIAAKIEGGWRETDRGKEKSRGEWRRWEKALEKSVEFSVQVEVEKRKRPKEESAISRERNEIRKKRRTYLESIPPSPIAQFRDWSIPRKWRQIDCARIVQICWKFCVIIWRSSRYQFFTLLCAAKSCHIEAGRTARNNNLGEGDTFPLAYANSRVTFILVALTFFISASGICMRMKLWLKWNVGKDAW